ncbi:hypothetical protein GCM10010317_091130 [Streptomyces mirabilis]|nr:hypothetical protein GCM10010317_091130 [Streptomyces mirabilis]
MLRESEARDRAAFIELFTSPEVHTPIRAGIGSLVRPLLEEFGHRTIAATLSMTAWATPSVT